ncbi:MAG: hypothetical protein ACRD8Z_26220 [Nitrososphaeraceae archaeon]
MRPGGIADPVGNYWFQQYIKGDLSKDELEKRAEDCIKPVSQISPISLQKA